MLQSEYQVSVDPLGKQSPLGDAPDNLVPSQSLNAVLQGYWVARLQGHRGAGLKGCRVADSPIAPSHLPPRAEAEIHISLFV